MLKSSKLISPAYINVCGCKKNQGIVFTRNRDSLKNQLTLKSIKTDLSYQDRKGFFFLVFLKI
jgi:hypothetical protein